MPKTEAEWRAQPGPWAHLTQDQTTALIEAERAPDKKRIAELEQCLRATRLIVVDGALVGFNPQMGEWADRLFKNQGAISKLLDR